jgi:hypothetical protein
MPLKKGAARIRRSSKAKCDSMMAASPSSSRGHPAYTLAIVSAVVRAAAAGSARTLQGVHAAR